jgi:hypothetical protein
MKNLQDFSNKKLLNFDKFLISFFSFYNFSQVYMRFHIQMQFYTQNKC